jgi:hypothetical protein
MSVRGGVCVMYWPVADAWGRVRVPATQRQRIRFRRSEGAAAMCPLFLKKTHIRFN